ncbi:MAG: GIY-YIG nuclease family protein [Candidatus Omnitrophota bacterium]
MYYVYVLRSKADNQLYYGYTNNIERRFAEHNIDFEWDLIYYEAFFSEKDARLRERKLKDYGQSRTHLKNRIQHSLKRQN